MAANSAPSAPLPPAPSPFARARQTLLDAIGLAFGLLRAFVRSPSAARRLFHDIRAPHPALDELVQSIPEPPQRNPVIVHAQRFPGLAPTPETIREIFPILYPRRAADLDSVRRAASIRRARAETAPKPPLAVVIPVHDHPELLPPLAASLLEHTPGDVLLLFVDDASCDPRVRPALLRLAAAWPGRVAVECLDRPHGFAGACNHGLRAAGRRDVILLNSDTVVSPRWSDTLRLAAYGGGRIGSVSAVSNHASFVSVPEPGFNEMPPGLSVAETARAWFHAPDRVFDRHEGHGFCLYLRRDMLDEVGFFDEKTFATGYGEEVDLCLRAFRLGWLHRTEPRVFVWHLNAASFGQKGKDERTRQAGERLLARYPERPALQAANRRGFTHARPNFREVADTLAKGARPKPRVLFVVNGATEDEPMQTVKALASALRGCLESYLFFCRGPMVRLAVLQGTRFVPLERRILSDWMPLGAHALPDFDDALVDWVLEYGIELVHVHHLRGGSAGFFRRLAGLHVPVLFTFPDCFVAPREEESFSPPLPPPAGHEAWQQRFSEEIAPFCRAFAIPSPGAKAHLQARLAVLRQREGDVSVIPPGSTFAAFESLAVPPRAGEPLRLVVPGPFRAADGARLVEAMAAEDGGRTVEFHVLGCDGTLDAAASPPLPGVVLHAASRRGEWFARVRDIRPAFALVIPPQPTAWCHVLTRCWAAGLPVAVPDAGSPGERLRGECPADGWLLPPDGTPAEQLERLRAFAADRDGFVRAVEAVRAWQNGPGVRADATRMAARYLDVYRRLLDASGEGAVPDAPAPFAAEKTRELVADEPALLDRTDLSGIRTLRLAGLPSGGDMDGRIRLLCRLCGTRLALDLRGFGAVTWRRDGVLRHALVAAADEVARPNRPALDAEGFPYLRPRRYVPPASWLLEERERAWAAAKAARAGRYAKTVVYTAITGGYDGLKRPEAPDGQVDYVCFAATPPPGERGPWSLRPFAWTDDADPVRTARWHKLHGCELFDGAETVIWVDGNITLRAGSEREIAEKLRTGGHPLATLKHFDRSNVADEVDACIERGKDDAETMRAQLARYRAAGLPDDAPFAETSILAFRPADPRVRAIFATWWEELAAGSRRDQLSLPFALWKHAATFTPLFDCDIRLAEEKVYFEAHARMGRVDTGADPDVGGGTGG